MGPFDGVAVDVDGCAWDKQIEEAWDGTDEDDDDKVGGMNGASSCSGGATPISCWFSC